MTRDEIIRMAREACAQEPREDWDSTAWVFGDEGLERFAALVAEHEREHGIKLLLDVLIDAAVKAEREACAKVAFNAKTYIEAAAAIRARGQE